MENKTLLVISPGSDVYQDSVFNILVAETGESLASHFCSHAGWAKSDLYAGRPERIKEWEKRFGKIEVKFINETDVSEEELVKRNHKWYEKEKEKDNDLSDQTK